MHCPAASVTQVAVLIATPSKRRTTAVAPATGAPVRLLTRTPTAGRMRVPLTRRKKPTPVA